MSDVSNAAAAPDPRSEVVFDGPFAPAGPGARVAYAWATPAVQAMLFLLSAVPVLIFAVIYSGVAIAGGEAPDASDGGLLAGSLIIQFPAWIALTLVWVRQFERRSLASAGFCGPAPFKRYAIGVAVGVGAIFAMGALSAPFAPQDEVMPAPSFAALATLPWLLTIAGVLLLFVVQSASEEIAFRGWMLSALGLRRGVVIATAVSTLAFAALHVHFFRADTLEITMILVVVVAIATLWGWLGRKGLIGGGVLGVLLLAVTPWSLTPGDLLFGAVAMTAIGFVGLFLALWAVNERSIYGVCGIHFAFNAAAVVVGMIMATGEDPGISPWGAFVKTLGEATATAGEASLAGAAVQLLVFAALSGAMLYRLKRKAGP